MTSSWWFKYGLLSIELLRRNFSKGLIKIQSVCLINGFNHGSCKTTVVLFILDMVVHDLSKLLITCIYDNYFILGVYGGIAFALNEFTRIENHLFQIWLPLGLGGNGTSMYSTSTLISPGKYEVQTRLSSVEYNSMVPNPHPLMHDNAINSTCSDGHAQPLQEKNVHSCTFITDTVRNLKIVPWYHT